MGEGMVTRQMDKKTENEVQLGMGGTAEQRRTESGCWRLRRPGLHYPRRSCCIVCLNY